MKKWPTKPLGEISELYQPKTITSAEILSEGPYKVFGANGVIGFYDQYNHEKAEVAVTCRGATCGTVNFTEPKSWITGNAMVVTPKDKYLDKRYLFYALKASDMTTIISGSAQPQITRQSFAPMKIPVPPPADQERIVKLLDEAEELRKLRAQADHRAADLIPALFHEMFGDPATNPKGWELVHLIDVVSKEKHSIKRGPFGGAIKKEIFVPEGYKLYEQKNAIRDDFEIGSYFIDEAKFNELKSFSILPDDLIISCSGTMGKVAIVPNDAKPGIINQALLKLRLDKTRTLPIFFKHLLESDHLHKLIFGGAAGSAIKNVMPLDQVKKTVFPLPPIPLQNEFAQRVTEIRELEARQATSCTRLDCLFQSMLHRALSGEL